MFFYPHNKGRRLRDSGPLRKAKNRKKKKKESAKTRCGRGKGKGEEKRERILSKEGKVTR